MAKLTIGFGILLVLLGIFGFVATGSAHPTALIPVWIGLLFVLFGVMANTENSKKRMLWMHISVTVALLVFLGMIPARHRCRPARPRRFFPLPRGRGRKSNSRALLPDLCPVLRAILHHSPPQPPGVDAGQGID